MKDLVIGYFNENPSAKEEVMKAYYAYHVEHFRCDPHGHNFSGRRKDSPCLWCKRTRELVRWDSLSGECLKRPVIKEIEDVIHDEEIRYFRLLLKAEKDVPKFIKKHGMNGEALAKLHHTYGYDIEVTSGIIDVPLDVMNSYFGRMENEKMISKAAHVTEEITIKNI